MLDSEIGNVTDGVCDGVCDGRRLSQAEGVTEVWVFGKDSFEECPMTIMTFIHIFVYVFNGLD